MDKLIGYYIRLQNVLRSEKGQGMVEYALIIALVAVALITALTGLKNGISGTFGNATNKL